jgi:segregation and condensation protein B
MNENDPNSSAESLDVADDAVSMGVADKSVSTDGIDGEASTGGAADESESTDNVGESDSQIQQDDGDGADAMRVMEALLFASEELLTPAKLKALIPGAPDVRRLRKMAGDINAMLRKEGHPFEIVEAGGGYQFRTLVLYHPYVRKLYKERAAKKLSLQALECLAIIAYRQPISKAEVEAIRGVLSDGAMKTLLERKLVDICGRSDKPGRPLLYGTTNDFLRYFGINKLSDLPRIEEFESLARAKMEEMSAEELSVTQEPIGDGVDNVDSVDIKT